MAGENDPLPERQKDFPALPGDALIFTAPLGY
jgi:hypothetical protein